VPESDECEINLSRILFHPKELLMGKQAI
jgi:hypothetical protein